MYCGRSSQVLLSPLASTSNQGIFFLAYQDMSIREEENCFCVRGHLRTEHSINPKESDSTAYEVRATGRTLSIKV